MARALEGVAAERGVSLSAEQRDLLGRSLPGWRAFPEVPAALERARERGWRLVILSNTDRDFIEASMERIEVPFEFAIVASEIGLLQARPRPLADVRQAHGRGGRLARARGRELVPRRRPGLRPGAADDFGSTGWPSAPT